ncbi:MAG: class I SAM-dependent methyltransferase [Burkholderiaceae bacterium]|nr:class I SAM-dependent methyltransferase [Burkholderiaceae bacterium]
MAIHPQELGAAAPAVAPPGEAAQAWRDLHAAASARYRPCGLFAHHFARGKLRRDPVFRALLAGAAIAPGARVLDIGCGQALLASLLAACATQAAAGRWPAAWGAPPIATRYCGIELMPRDVTRAERALAALATPPRLVCADMRQAAFEPCDVAVILDVLHYVDTAAQDDVLERVRRALAPRGRLLLRVGDPSQRLRFAVGRSVDHVVTRARGHRAPPLWWRRIDQWRTALQRLGFAVRAEPMSRGTPFANVLLVCDLP